MASPATWKYDNVQPDPNTIVFYGNKICPFANRPWWVSFERNIPIEFIHIPLGAQKPEWIYKVNPKGKVPFVQYQGQVLTESALIAQFFDDLTADQGSLYGSDPFEKFFVRTFVEEFSEMVKDFYQLLSAPNDDYETVKNRLHQNMARVDESLRSQDARNQAKGVSGKLFLGDKLSFAEIMVIPFYERMFPAINKFKNTNIFESQDGKPLDRLKEWWSTARNLESFKKTMEGCDDEFWINIYKNYTPFKSTQ